jgi:hypothetical protein
VTTVTALLTLLRVIPHLQALNQMEMAYVAKQGITMLLALLILNKIILSKMENNVKYQLSIKDKMSPKIKKCVKLAKQLNKELQKINKFSIKPVYKKAK